MGRDCQHEECRTHGPELWKLQAEVGIRAEWCLQLSKGRTCSDSCLFRFQDRRQGLDMGQDPAMMCLSFPCGICTSVISLYLSVHF